MSQTVSITSEAILAEAESVWSAARLERRNASLRVGALLAQYILARLIEADGLNEFERLARHLTRERSMEDAAERLRIKIGLAYELVRVAKVVELLGDPGNLSYSTLRAFTVFVGRRPCTLARGRCAKPGVEVSPAESETWEVKTTQSGHDPREMYASAVLECWNSTYVRELIAREVKVSRKGGPGPRPVLSRGAGPRNVAPPSLRDLGRSAHPSDLADMVLELVAQCPALKELLLRRLGGTLNV